jgi:antitoxin component HigA of HigAB toxin-antitoxin module
MANRKQRRLPSMIDAVEFRRDQYQLTQSEWAKVIGIRPSHYSEFSNGKRCLTLAQAAQCFAFGVPAECLFQQHPTKHIRHINAILKDPS